MRMRREVPGDVFIVTTSLGSGLDDAGDGSDDALELRELERELFAAGGGELVVARAAVAGGGAPLGCDPALDQHARQRGKSGAFFDLQDTVGGLLDLTSISEAGKLAEEGEGFEDQRGRAKRVGFRRVSKAASGFKSYWHS